MLFRSDLGGEAVYRVNARLKIKRQEAYNERLATIESQVTGMLSALGGMEHGLVAGYVDPGARGAANGNNWTLWVSDNADALLTNGLIRRLKSDTAAITTDLYEKIGCSGTPKHTPVALSMPDNLSIRETSR